MKNNFSEILEKIKKHLIYELIIDKDDAEMFRTSYTDLENYIAQKTYNNIILRKARFVSIELIENVLKYGYFTEEYASYINIAFFDNKFYFSSGNLVKNEEVPYIDQRLKEINSAYSDENPRQFIRSIYREKLSQVGITENDVKIGILELARRVDDRIFYRFSEFNEKYSEFTIICTINA